jgi:hypothetical protein
MFSHSLGASTPNVAVMLCGGPVTRRVINYADHFEGRQSGCNLHLDIDGARLDALECDRRDALNH